MDRRVIDICKRCGDNKTKAIKMVHDELHYDLLTSKSEVNKVNNEITPAPQNHKSGIMRLFKQKREIKKADTLDDHKNHTEICDLYRGNQNKYGTFVLSKYTLYYDNDRNMYSIDKKGSNFVFEDVIWKGKNIINNTITVSDTTGKEKNKRTGRILGAAIGTVLAPGLGTVIGAAHGTGNSKNKNASTTVTRSYEQIKEEVSDIVLYVKYETGQSDTLKYQCYEKQAMILLNLIDGVKERPNKNNNHHSPYEEIKSLKELLDMGAITQEEFDIKKKEILGF